MLSHLRALRARFIRNIKSLRGTNTTRVNDKSFFEPFLRLVITASSSNQNWTWRSQRPHPVASSQCQGLTQILSPSLIIGNLHEEFNLLQLAHFSCGWRCFTWSQKRWIRIPWCLSREVEFHWNLMVASRLIVCTSLSMYRMLHRYQLALVVNVTLLFSL